MKINDKVLNIPPYVSTTWNQISAIHMKGSLLVVTLKDGDAINIPKLHQETIDTVFHHHAEALEKIENSNPFDSIFNNSELTQTFSETQQMPPFSEIQQMPSTPSFQLAFGTLDGLHHIMQHNPEHANAPELPIDLIQKITAITKILAADDSLALPKPESHCNCFHCQIARAITPSDADQMLIEMQSATEETEVISDEELQFQQWNIHQTNDKLFIVTNKLDEKEQYNVYLGEPLGCTCGRQGCEHMLAVLKS
jgi:hypothetical protein